MALDQQLEIAWRARPARGEYRCGDLVVIEPVGEGSMLVALIDGLGHGRLAEEAAQAAGAFVRAHAGLPLELLFSRCSEAISDTRGVAMSVVRLSGDPLGFEHAGVGNVALASVTREAVATQLVTGVVGQRPRKLASTRHGLHSGDLLLLFTDGISSRLDLIQLREEKAEQTVDAVMRGFAKAHDDAACVAIECKSSA